MLYIKRSRLKTLLDGWVGGGQGNSALRIAYSNQKRFYQIHNNVQLSAVNHQCLVPAKKPTIRLLSVTVILMFWFTKVWMLNTVGIHKCTGLVWYSEHS
jgi:hypothetical protein